ncbi:MAG: TMEM165/GDT1 family protein [Leptolyngbyaceae cyanobacterium CSU_1_3]|nr:TMEM165/GDT1 family protein [Leptolyngbyaceae cyanobacterium CSU_1_3]
MALTELSILELINLQKAETLVEEESSVLEGPTPDRPLPSVTPNSRWSFWGVFGSTFVTIFLAELGDKTQLATLLMSAESHAPWVVFTGAASALVATSLIGVLVGRWLHTRLSPKTLERATGTLLLVISALLLLDVIRL